MRRHFRRTPSPAGFAETASDGVPALHAPAPPGTPTQAQCAMAARQTASPLYGVAVRSAGHHAKCPASRAGQAYGKDDRQAGRLASPTFPNKLRPVHHGPGVSVSAVIPASQPTFCGIGPEAKGAGMIGLLMFTTIAGTGGSFETGNTLYSKCTDPAWTLACTAFIAGVMDTLTLEASVGKQIVCADNTVTEGQAKDVVVNYLRDHPESRNLTGALIATVAMKQAWPCPG